MLYCLLRNGAFSICFALSWCISATASFGQFIRNNSLHTEKRYKVVIHIDSERNEIFDKAIKHLQNLLDDRRIKNQTTVALMANSEGARLLVTNDKYRGKLQELANRGIRFKICANTMERFKITKAMIYPFVQIVDSAVGELTILQSRGYGYIHPAAPPAAADDPAVQG